MTFISIWIDSFEVSNTIANFCGYSLTKLVVLILFHI